MQVGILGPLEVRDERGAPIKVTGARLRAVLVRLALDAGRPVSPAQLVDTVWGAQPPADETNALQTLVSRLRRTLGDARLVEQSSAGYRLAIQAADVDAHRFETWAADGSRALRNGDPGRAAQLLRAGLALWRGPALADAGDSLAGPARRLAELRLAAVLDRLAADIELGDADVVVTELDELSSEFPLDERIAAQLITALASSGRQAEALRSYGRVRERLADELGVDPSADLQAVHLAVLRGELTAGKSPVATRRTNLIAQLTSFVGREEEVSRVGKAVQENRLVTLVGPGGAGKTRLANEAGARLVSHDGVWLAELAPVTDAADVAQAVLTALGLREKKLLDRRPTRPAQDVEGRLVEVLSDKSAVLVLDNCEHLIDACARLAGHLLGQCPQLRVLATSREPLGITGEVVLAVPPLAQPDPEAGATLALEYPAVRLFADRAAAARPGFEVDDANVATVIEIVRRLDGLPLAIELAAARLRSMPAAEIATRLSDRFGLLTGGSRTALPRHRTLRAVVEWSWELLTEAERLTAERLSVFPAGVTIDSAVAVVADDVVAADAVADLLGSLIDKSLLQLVGDGQRMRMLETIREYGAERLSERGELARLRARHADYFTALLDQAQPHLTSSGQLPWLDRLTDERDNILAALRFRCDSGAADPALHIAVGISGFAMILGNHSDIGSWISEALAVPGATDEALLWIARALYAINAAAAGGELGEVDDGVRQLQLIAQNLAKIEVDSHPLVGILRPAIAFFAGDEELTARMLDEGLASKDEWMRATTRMLRASLAENNGDVALMGSDVDIALAEFRRLGERWGLANTLRSKAMLLSMAGELDAAETAYEEAFELMAQMKSREDEAFLLVRMADLASRRGERAKAHALLQRAAESAEESGSAMESVFTLSMLAEAEREAGHLERARTLQGDAMHRIRSMQPGHPALGHARAIVLSFAARLAFTEGDVSGAVQLGQEAYLAALATKDLPILASVGVVLAVIAADTGRGAVAAELLGASARLRGSEDATSIEIARLLNILPTDLGTAEFARHYDHGKGLDRQAALTRLDPAVALAGLPGLPGLGNQDDQSAQTRRP